MIDTDKYEGHTPGPWHEIFMQGDEYNNGYDDLQTLGFNGTAQDLIADAPDLLAEVKRLRETLATIKGDIDGYVSGKGWDGNIEGWQCISDSIAALGIESESEEE